MCGPFTPPRFQGCKKVLEVYGQNKMTGGKTRAV